MPTVAQAANAKEPINDFFRFGLSPPWGLDAQAGHMWTLPGRTKSQVPHMNAPQSLHRWVAATWGCWTQQVPVGIGSAAAGSITGGESGGGSATPGCAKHSGQSAVPSGSRNAHVQHIGLPQSRQRNAAFTSGCCVQRYWLTGIVGGIASPGMAGGSSSLTVAACPGAGCCCRKKSTLYSPPCVSHRTESAPSGTSFPRHSGQTRSIKY